LAYPESIIFETSRLTIRKFNMDDAPLFFDLMGNPKVMNPIPLKALTKDESDAKLNQLISEQDRPGDKQIWAMNLKNDSELIGLCAVLTNDDQEPELGYRIREQYWSKGYGTEIAVGLIKYCFLVLDKDIVTADASLKNKKSLAILEKLMSPKKEFFNKSLQCLDRRYLLSKEDWIKINNGE